MWRCKTLHLNTGVTLRSSWMGFVLSIIIAKFATIICNNNKTKLIMNKQLLFRTIAFVVALSCAFSASAANDLCDFTVDGIFYKIKSDGVYVYFEDDTSWDPCYTNESYNIPSAVTYNNETYLVTGVGNTAFWGCVNVKSISLPSTINTIETDAFHGCSSLQVIICNAITPPSLKPSSFDNTTYNTATLYVPDNAVSAYKAAANWMSFSNIKSMSECLSDALNVDGGNISFFSTGDPFWTVMVDGDNMYAQSGNKGIANSFSMLYTGVEVLNTSILSFDFKAWGEGGSTNIFDKCIFTVDGEEIFRYGALKNDWETYTVELTAGTHSVAWSYVKDGSVNPVGDFFAVDNVSLVEKPVQVMRGDVNDDGNVSISDVTALIDYLLSGNASDLNMTNADTNQDGNVNISDVTTLIDYLLSGMWPAESFTVNGVTFKMIPVEGGSFYMGADDSDPLASSNEKPAHKVTLSSFSIGETEVTQALWYAVMGLNPSYFPSFDYPVEAVSWEQCQEFIAQLNQVTGKTFRLPTEAEWEFAARGGKNSTGYRFAGSNNIGTVAWYSSNSDGTTHPVATKAPNELGLYDMSGNVFEYCADRYSADYYSNSPEMNPTGPEEGTFRVIRGGSWMDPIDASRVTSRYSTTPTYRSKCYGLRLAM